MINRRGMVNATQADVATATLANLEDFGAPCWRRWMQAITLNAPIVTYPTWDAASAGSAAPAHPVHNLSPHSR